MSSQASASVQEKNWRLENLLQDERLGRSRVSAIVDGEEIWFETNDAPLSASPEGFASLFILPALNRSVKLILDDYPLDGRWLDNIEQLLPIWHNWWGYSLENPLVASRREALSEPPATRSGACFTGGVDSFYTALHSRYKIDVLIFIHGYDIPLEDEYRMQAFEPVLRQVAEKLNKSSVLIRTNLREHHCFTKSDWQRIHGAALAGPAHFLSSYIGRIIVPSSLTYNSLHPWGSHWMTDPFFSSSSLSVIYDYAASRSEKIRLLAAEPLPRKYLRVCWENRQPQGNCSGCEKCLRTMISLAGAGRLADFTVFDQTQPLARRLRNLSRAPEHLLHVFAKLDREELPPDVSRALKRLIRRSRKYYQPGLIGYVVRQIKWLASQPAARIPKILWRLTIGRLLRGERKVLKNGINTW